MGHKLASKGQTIVYKYILYSSWNAFENFGLLWSVGEFK